MAPTMGDRRLDRLIDLFERTSEEIADLMAEIPLAEDEQTSAALYAMVLQLLMRLRKQAHDWAQETVEEIYREADREAASVLQEIGLLEAAVWGAGQQREVQELVRYFDAEIGTTLHTIQAQAAGLRRGQGLSEFTDWKTSQAVAAGTLGALALATLRGQIRRKLRDGMVRVLGSNARSYRYSLDYYTSLLVNRLKYEAISRATLLRSMQSGHDLVQVSPNPSTIGDYCDEYRGKVFSISGMHAHYPPVSEIPSGGCPMHPHCHHSLRPFTGMDDTGPVRQEFADLAAAGGAGPNDFQRMWNARAA